MISEKTSTMDWIVIGSTLIVGAIDFALIAMSAGKDFTES